MKTLTTLTCLLACSLPFATLAQAPGDVPDQYSHAITLELSGKNALAQVRLPPAVYLHARSEHLHDVRIFDAAGKALPFALLEPVELKRTGSRALPAAIFPVHADAEAQARDKIEIRTAAGGTITAITTGGASAGKEQVLNALVLDFGKAAAGQTIDALVFTPPPGTGNYAAQVALEVSDDLRNWDTLAYASLSWLSNEAQQSLSSNRMDLPARAFRYGRLVWREGKPIRFAAINAQVTVAETVGAPMDSITLQPKTGRFPQDLMYQAGPAIPAERLKLTFGPGNVVMPATLGHYVALPPPRGKIGTRYEFAPHLQATFYQYTQNGAQRSSGDIDAQGMRAAEWVLRPQAPLAAPPTMTLSWRPGTLVFMASGSAPYSLHVGRAGAPSTQQAIGAVAPGLSALELGALERATTSEARARSPQSVAALASKAQAAETAAARRKWILWGVLLLGVVVLGVMAVKLSRQMKDEA